MKHKPKQKRPGLRADCSGSDCFDELTWSKANGCVMTFTRRQHFFSSDSLGGYWNAALNPAPFGKGK
jgi:hypothetical protein